MCHHGNMSINENTAKHTRRILRNRTLSAGEITAMLGKEVSAPDAYNPKQIEGMLKQMPDVEEIDGKFRLKNTHSDEDVNQAAARIVRQATQD
jgi:predicted FMN-binding regulatory protein PaiB